MLKGEPAACRRGRLTAPPWVPPCHRHSSAVVTYYCGSEAADSDGLDFGRVHELQGLLRTLGLPPAQRAAQLPRLLARTEASQASLLARLLRALRDQGQGDSAGEELSAILEERLNSEEEGEETDEEEEAMRGEEGEEGAEAQPPPPLPQLVFRFNLDGDDPVRPTAAAGAGRGLLPK